MNKSCKAEKRTTRPALIRQIKKELAAINLDGLNDEVGAKLYRMREKGKAHAENISRSFGKYVPPPRLKAA